MATRAAGRGLVLALALVGCSGSREPNAVTDTLAQVTSPDEFWLAMGDEVRVDGILRVGFAGVPADSRCPTSVVCVWQGDAAAEIHYGLGMGPSYPDTLHTALEPHGATFGGYRITLLDVGPYPQTTDPIPPDEYAIRLRVEHTAR